MTTVTRESLLHAYDTITAMAMAAITPEALAEADRAKKEMGELFKNLNSAFNKVEGVLRERGIKEQEIPYWVPSIRGWRPRLCFLIWDGENLLGGPNGEKPQQVYSLPVAHRTAPAAEVRFLV